MPSPYVKKLSKELGISTSKIEELWKKAKEITSDTFGVKESDFGEREYAYTVGVVKKMLGISEDSIKPIDFLKSEQSAKEFIETVISADFNIGNITVYKQTDIEKNSVIKNVKDMGTPEQKVEPSKSNNQNTEDEDELELGLDGIKIKEGEQKKDVPKQGSEQDIDWIEKLIGLDGFQIVEQKQGKIKGIIKDSNVVVEKDDNMFLFMKIKEKKVLNTMLFDNIEEVINVLQKEVQKNEEG